MYQHRGYEMEVRANLNNDTLYGRVSGIKSNIRFEGRNLKELKAEFCRHVDDYLDRCKRKNRNPEKAFSGKILLRTDSDTHRSLFLTAAKENKSINSWLEYLVKQNVSDYRDLLEEMYLVELDYDSRKDQNVSIDKGA